jgi:hypothetical protein
VNRFNTSEPNQNWRVEPILTMENWKWNNIKLKNPIFIFDLKHPFSYFSPLILYPSKTQRLRSISYKLGSISYIKIKLVTSVFTANLVSQDWNKHISIYYVHIPPTYFYFSWYKSHIHMHKFCYLFFFSISIWATPTRTYCLVNLNLLSPLFQIQLP